VNPAYSVILLTTLTGAGQGLFLALFAAELAGPAAPPFLATGAAAALALNALGLLASFFHLGHPERAWRAAAMWRTSWLSREVIALPLFMAGLAAWGAAHFFGWPGTRQLGVAASLLCLALFVCTAMIYASIKFLREWASPLTLVNYTLLGCASGCTLATVLAAWLAPALTRPYAITAALLTAAGLATRALSLRRNAALKPKSTLQTALGIKHPRIEQKAQGCMGGSFNTREFFHGRPVLFLRNVKWLFLALAFVLPIALLVAGATATSPLWFALAFALQYVGLLAERWYFFAQANHPQNLYYQVIS
jgi:sulfite dehydrogenase (quinone) subunit SoeC